MQSVLLSWLANSPALAVPYALAALGLIIGERSGVLSLGAEGLMLVGALADQQIRDAIEIGLPVGFVELAYGHDVISEIAHRRRRANARGGSSSCAQ